MVKDAKMTSTKYVEILLEAISKETSDSIFEKQIDFASMSINSYTPIANRGELNDKMFNFILNLIPQVKDN